VLHDKGIAADRLSSCIDVIRRQHQTVTMTSELVIDWVKRDAGSWLMQRLDVGGFTPPESQFAASIEALAADANRLGPRPLWHGYATADGERYSDQPPPFRSADQVRTGRQMGNLFTFLVRQRRPKIVVEFGTAFGVSGMYWLAGLELNNHGELLTFEPNMDWAGIARNNLKAIGERFRLMSGTFEDQIDRELHTHDRIDIAFIDAIHTCAFVRPQFELVTARLASNGLVLFDDIDFSSDMKACWERIARGDGVLASATVANRVGIVEMV
jgi:predicted O-methyltransferase YrrM